MVGVLFFANLNFFILGSNVERFLFIISVLCDLKVLFCEPV